MSAPPGSLRALTFPGDHVPRAQSKQGQGPREELGFGGGAEWRQVQLLQPLREKDPACLEWPDLANEKTASYI